MTRSFAVTFEPSHATVLVPEGTTVLEAARSAGVPLGTTCGGRGNCGDCAVKVLEGSVAPPSRLEAAGLLGAPPSVRLGCLLKVTSRLVVRPVTSPPR